jgi:hypothetical protein
MTAVDRVFLEDLSGVRPARELGVDRRRHPVAGRRSDREVGRNRARINEPTSFWVTAPIGRTAAFGMAFIAVNVTVITLVALIGGPPFRSLLRGYVLKRKDRAQRAQPGSIGSRTIAESNLFGVTL